MADHAPSYAPASDAIASPPPSESATKIALLEPKLERHGESRVSVGRQAKVRAETETETEDLSANVVASADEMIEKKNANAMDDNQPLFVVAIIAAFRSIFLMSCVSVQMVQAAVGLWMAFKVFTLFFWISTCLIAATIISAVALLFALGWAILSDQDARGESVSASTASVIPWSRRI